MATWRKIPRWRALRARRTPRHTSLRRRESLVAYLHTNQTIIMASFTMSTARIAAPAKVSGLGFRKAVASVGVTAKAPVAPKSVSMVVVAGKPGQKAKTNKSAAKRFKITASGKVRTRDPSRASTRALSGIPDALG